MHLASRSVTFEPDGTNEAVLVFPFDVVLNPSASVRVSECRNKPAFAMHSGYAFTTAQHGVPCPHRTMKVPSEKPSVHIFVLPWDANFIDRFHFAYTEYKNGRPITSTPEVSFDYSSLTNVSELVICNEDVEIVEPLLRIPSIAVLTDRYLYLQSRYSCVQPRKVPLDAILRCEKRRCDLRDTAVEMHYGSGSGEASGTFFLQLRTESKRNTFYRSLEQQSATHFPKAETLKAVMDGWLHGSVSTFDYLMYLNWLAGRTMADLSSYPVFPWVLKDYSSKTIDLSNPGVFRDLNRPIGALNASRLAYFKERMQESQEPYLYGTHYSSPGYMVYFLVREHPEWMLKVHNGEFDKPDRLFESIEKCWLGVSTQPNDIKELIPQFFCGTGEFLKAKHGSDFGRKGSSGMVKADVKVPPWAASPEDFVRINREALEGEHCSASVHHWIDLIFGCKARGERAFQANNLFHPLTYDAAHEIEKESDPTLRQSLEAQVREFGQCPLQLFDDPHPQRKVAKTAADLLAHSDDEAWLPPVRERSEAPSSPTSAVPTDIGGSFNQPWTAVPTKTEIDDILRKIESNKERQECLLVNSASADPLVAVLHATLELLGSSALPYSDELASSCVLQVGGLSVSSYSQSFNPSLPSSGYGTVSTNPEVLYPANDADFSSLFHEHFIPQDSNKSLDDIVWFVPKSGGFPYTRRRAEPKSFPPVLSPLTAWTESLLLNIAVQWQYEAVIAVVHEIPRVDGTLYAADWFTRSLHASPTVDSEGESVTFPDLFFGCEDTEAVSRVPPGAFLWTIEINAVLGDMRVPVKRAALGYVDVARKLTHHKAKPSASQKHPNFVKMRANECVHVEGSFDVQAASRFLRFRGRKKERDQQEPTLLIKTCSATVDRLKVAAAIRECAQKRPAERWLYLPEETSRSAPGVPPADLPALADCEGCAETDDSMTPSPNTRCGGSFSCQSPSKTDDYVNVSHFDASSPTHATQRDAAFYLEENHFRNRNNRSAEGEVDEGSGEPEPAQGVDDIPVRALLVSSPDKLPIDPVNSAFPPAGVERLPSPACFNGAAADGEADESDESLPDVARGEKSNAVEEANAVLPEVVDEKIEYTAELAQLEADTLFSPHGGGLFDSSFAKRLLVVRGSFVFAYAKAAPATAAANCIYIYSCRLQIRRRRLQPQFVVSIHTTVPRSPGVTDVNRTVEVGFSTDEDRDTFISAITPFALQLV
eukprot:gene22667-34692_t